MLRALLPSLPCSAEEITIFFKKACRCYAKARGKAGMGVLRVIRFDVPEFLNQARNFA